MFALLASTRKMSSSKKMQAGDGEEETSSDKKQRRGSDAVVGSVSGAEAEDTGSSSKNVAEDATSNNNTQNNNKKGNPPNDFLSIDTSDAGTTNMANNNTNAAGPPSSSSSTTGTTLTPVRVGKQPMDQHPYARGAVIEILHGVAEDNVLDSTAQDGKNEGGEGDRKRGGDRFSNPEDEEWWNIDSDEDEVDDGDEEGKKEVALQESDEKDKNDNVTDTSERAETSVRLCDIIDRVQVGEGQYRYYVHYRDFNRRMDEWISMSRIISPPSVGNAKARALKKEEEKKKRQQQREEERKKLEQEAAVMAEAPRSSRRRSNMTTTPWAAQGSSTAAGTAAATAAGTDASTPVRGGGITPVELDAEGSSRRTRPRRRTGVDEDDATVVAGNQGDADGANADQDPPKPVGLVMAAEKGIVALPTAAATKVGEHVVQTIAAQELDEHEGLDEASLREHEEVTKVKNVAFVEIGPHQMETWYFSPLPKELLSERGFIEVLYVCEFSFRMFARKSELRRFQARIPTDRRHPPGNEIYRNGNLSMFEVDGFEERIYCQNLCYIAKLFLDHKTLYFDVDPFLFYVLCEVDDRGFHPVGYYSKEKYSDVGYNLACILTFPSHQRKGYGRFLIAFSYELSKKEERVGSPEKPMSDLGQQAYKPYWASTIVDFLLNVEPNAAQLSIMDISKLTSIMAEDIVFTLNQLGILKIINGVYFIAAEEGLLKTLAKKYPVKEPRVDASKLHWTAFVAEVKRDKFSIHSKKASKAGHETRGVGGF